MKKTTILEIIISVVLLVLLGIIGAQAITIRNQRLNSFCLNPGESISKLNLINLKNEPPNEKIFSPNLNKVTLLCIFQTPCSICSKSVGAWKALADYFRGRIAVIGIIPAYNPVSSNFGELGQLNFELYQPRNVEEFRLNMRLKSKLSQTIIVQGNKVIAIKIGDLDGEDFESLLKTIKNTFKTN